jgi:hypothetical protein
MHQHLNLGVIEHAGSGADHGPLVSCTRSDTRRQNPEWSRRSVGTPRRRANNLSDAWEAINAWTTEPGYVRTRLTNLYR